MARFFASIINGSSRRTETTVGGRMSVSEAHVRGWDAGVKVMCVKLDNGDAFDVYQTGGSHASSSDVLLGRLEFTRGMAAPTWIPAEDALTQDAMDAHQHTGPCTDTIHSALGYRNGVTS